MGSPWKPQNPRVFQQKFRISHFETTSTLAAFKYRWTVRLFTPNAVAISVTVNSACRNCIRATPYALPFALRVPCDPTR